MLAAMDSQSPEASLSGRVLLVEDNPVNRTLIGACLESFGLAHEAAADGEAALAALAREPFDLVLMDVRMPGMDGIAATEHIRALPGPASAVPVVALTGAAAEDERARALAAGMDGFLAKPFGAAELYAALAAHLGEGEKRAAAGG
jgi:CheY-like chemotaxis protein